MGGGDYTPSSEEFSQASFYFLRMQGIDPITAGLVATAVYKEATRNGVRSLHKSMNTRGTINNRGGGRKQRRTRRSRN
jgi:hypothetical protein